jgi:hypothetical protein
MLIQFMSSPGFPQLKIIEACTKTAKSVSPATDSIAKGDKRKARSEPRSADN